MTKNVTIGTTSCQISRLSNFSSDGGMWGEALVDEAKLTDFSNDPTFCSWL